MQDVIKILHLEDVESDVFLVEHELRKENILFESKIADSKEAYTYALQSFYPDIILSDHSLPAFNSVEALHIMRDMGYDIPFILVTGNVSEEFAAKMMKEGAWDYILKDRIQRLPSAVINAKEKNQLRKSEKKYIEEIITTDKLFKQAEQIAHFGVWKFDLESMHGTWSDETYRLLGFTPGKVEPSFENFLKNISKRDAQQIERVFKKSLASASEGFFEFHVQEKNAGKKFIKAEFIIERNTEGKPVSITGFLLDTTETALAKDSFFKSNADLRTIFNYTNTAYILLDSKLKVRSFNSKAYEFSVREFDRPLLENTTAISYFPKERHERLREIMKNVLSGEKVSYEVNYGSDDSKRWFDVSWIPIDNPDNKRLGLVLAIQEITDRKLAEIEKEKINYNLSQKNKDLRQFNYIVSHNLRLPLTNIMAISHLIKSMSTNIALDEWNNMTQMIEESCLKLDEVIKDLNVILEIKDGISEVQENVNLCTVIDDVKRSIKFNKDEQIEVECDPAGIPDILGIRSYVYSIFLNLISNSLRFKKEDESLLIKIKAVADTSVIRIIIDDNGKGFDIIKTRDKLYGLYKRFHQGIEGKGMGLFMVKTQVDRLGGTIEADSTPGKGTTFTITLPVVSALGKITP